MKCVRPNEFCLKRERAFRLWQGLYPTHRVKKFAVSISLFILENHRSPKVFSDSIPNFGKLFMIATIEWLSIAKMSIG